MSMMAPPFERILEIKQALDDRVENGAGRNDPSGTMKMLAQMRGVLSRELDRFAGLAGGADGEAIDGKAAVDLVSLIARTLEKIDQLERQIAESDMGADREMAPEERAALRQTVADMISALADRRLRKLQQAACDEALPAIGETGEKAGRTDNVPGADIQAGEDTQSGARTETGAGAEAGEPGADLP